MRGKIGFGGYVRANGEVGVRDYVLALPAVVCAAQAASHAVRGLSTAVAVEHPLGCGQIGADREQTQEVLVGVGSHPNVRGAVVLGLGCEGVPAADVAERIRRHRRPAEVVTIQAAGGTGEAAKRAHGLLQQMEGAAAELQASSLKHLCLGVAKIDELGKAGEDVVAAFLARGGRVLEIQSSGPHRVKYGERPPRDWQRTQVDGAVGANEAITGMVASGAQIVLEQGDAHYLGGHPIVPVIRIGYDETLRGALFDDLDGMINDRAPDEWVDWILDVANGSRTKSELSASVAFAIQRIGPTL